MTGGTVRRDRSRCTGGSVCLYPIIDRFDWDDPGHWHNSGLWEFREERGDFIRVLDDDYANELRNSQAALASLGYGMELGRC